MFDSILSLNPIWLAFITGLFTWGCTIFGAALIYFFKTINRRLLDVMMGSAADVMLRHHFGLYLPLRLNTLSLTTADGTGFPWRSAS